MTQQRLTVFGGYPDAPRHGQIVNAEMPDLENWDAEYVMLSGYSGKHGHACFAAAPDMLRVLKRLECWFDTDAEVLDAMSPDKRADHEHKHRMIRDVIAQAEGRG